MKRVIVILTAWVMLAAAVHADGDGGVPQDIALGNQLDSMQMQQTNVVGGGDSASYSEGGAAYAEGGDAVGVGGDATSDSVALAVGGNPSSNSSAGSNSGASINTTSISNYQGRTSPVSVAAPYLPYWTHGGWGTLKAYFPNGPSDDQVYERIFNPDNADDMKELRGVLHSLSYEGPLSFLKGILNGVGTMFGGPNISHRGRGFEIANSLIRTTRPKGKPLLVFIDSNVDRRLLKQSGYVYVGRVSIEGKVDRNWDHVYDAAVAEALPWDVDVLLVSGGMKGVTVGSNFTFPTAGVGYSQTNYSISLLGGTASGVTEGKGKAQLGGEGYRFWPEAAQRRQIPQFVSDRLHATPKQELAQAPQPQNPAQTSVAPDRRVSPTAAAASPERTAQAPAQGKTTPVAKKDMTPSYVGASAAPARQNNVGVQVSKELLDLAGFSQSQEIQNVIVR